MPSTGKSFNPKTKELIESHDWFEACSQRGSLQTAIWQFVKKIRQTWRKKNRKCWTFIILGNLLKLHPNNLAQQNTKVDSPSWERMIQPKFGLPVTLPTIHLHFSKCSPFLASENKYGWVGSCHNWKSPPTLKQKRSPPIRPGVERSNENCFNLVMGPKIVGNPYKLQTFIWKLLLGGVERSNGMCFFFR